MNNKLSLRKISKGVLIPTEEFITGVHDFVIENRKELGKNDPTSYRDKGLITHLCDVLADRTNKYKDDLMENSLYIASESFYYIACEHPFTEANKSTAFVVALTLLAINQMPENNKWRTINISTEKEYSLAAPDEARKIVQLAEGGADPDQLRRFIKEFLSKYIIQRDLNE